MNKAQLIYQKLRECYTSYESTNSDKAKRFRSIYEEFVTLMSSRRFTPQETLGSRLYHFFAEKNASPEVAEKSKWLVHALNTIVHDDRSVSNDELTQYYRTIIEIIESLTNETPDAKSQTLSGISDEWYLDKLNLEQRNAVVDDSQLISVNAGPGTGKTHLLLHKMLYYSVKNHNDNIVSLSFTNSAALQLKEKFSTLRDKYNQPPHSKCFIGTIHSFCYTLMVEYYKSIGEEFEVEILDNSDCNNIAEDIVSQYNLPPYDTSIIAEILEKGDSPYSSNYAKIVNDYKKEHKFIRIEELIKLFFDLCDTTPFTTTLQGRIDCLLVDESQDLTAEIYRVLTSLFNQNPQMNMFFVGDPRQNIFGFNGGSHSNFTSFIENCQIPPSEHKLTITYRCPQVVIDKVNPLKFLDCENPTLKLYDHQLQGSCQIIEAENPQYEAETIARIVDSIEDKKNVCVIATWLSCLSLTAECLNNLGIPFVIKGGQSTLSRPIKIINYCLKSVTQNKTYNYNRLQYYIKNFQNSPLHQFLESVEYNDQNPISIKPFIINVMELLLKMSIIDKDDCDLIVAYSEKVEIDDTVPNLIFKCGAFKNDTFSQFYIKNFDVACTTEITIDKQPVTLSTIHSAKGLEWENVIIASLSNSTLPSWSCYANGISVHETERRLNEERKKYYVAVTRCKKNLFLTYPKMSTNKWGKIFYSSISQFVV